MLSIPEWLAGHSTDWRVGRLREYPGVVVIEFPSLAEQGRAMNRIAALLEKRAAPRDRLLDDHELGALIEAGGDTSATFYQGHDYGGDALARFFNLADAQRLALNASETRLQQSLLGAGVLSREAPLPGSYRSPGTQAVISFTAVQPDDPSTRADEAVDERRRESVLRHEASHGRFHTRPAYREHSRDFWFRVLSDAQRRSIREHLARSGYNPDNEELMLDEAQAFLMNTADERAFSARDIGMTGLELDALRTRFWRTLPADEQPGSSLPASAGAFSPPKPSASPTTARP